MTKQTENIIEIRNVTKQFGSTKVLHDLSLAACYAHRVVVMQGGRVLADDVPDASLCDSVVETAFGVPLRRVEVEGVPVFVLARAMRARREVPSAPPARNADTVPG